MITPLMLLLSCLDEDYTYTPPIDLSYLCKADRMLIVKSALALGDDVQDGDRVCLDIDMDSLEPILGWDGKPRCSIYQNVNGDFTTVHPATAVILTKLYNAYDLYKTSNLMDVGDELQDFSLDTVSLRLEGHPEYIYPMVLTLMRSNATYKEKMDYLYTLYTTLAAGAGKQDGQEDISISERDYSRLELHSQASYWVGLIKSELIRNYGGIDTDVTEADLYTVRKELDLLGFRGFVNPLSVFEKFRTSRVNRKSILHVDRFVLDYLGKVVQCVEGRKN